MKEKTKSFTIHLSNEDRLDVKIKITDDKVKGFVLNYRTLIKGKFRQIYRVDTAHGYLHEQRFWLSPKPVKIKRGDLDKVLNELKERLSLDYWRYKKLYEEALRNGKIKNSS